VVYGGHAGKAAREGWVTEKLLVSTAVAGLRD